jgi:hypothetical protein
MFFTKACDFPEYLYGDSMLLTIEAFDILNCEEGHSEQKEINRMADQGRVIAFAK